MALGLHLPPAEPRAGHHRAADNARTNSRSIDATEAAAACRRWPAGCSHARKPHRPRSPPCGALS
eukprot:366569-Chlamydomonas_euryale.AAC.13